VYLPVLNLLAKFASLDTDIWISLLTAATLAGGASRVAQAMDFEKRQTPRSAASAVNLQVTERDVTVARRNEISRNTRPERERRSALGGHYATRTVC